MEFSIISNRRIADCRDDNADIMRRLYFQGSQFFIQGIVGCLRRTPLDRIGIFCCADFRDVPGGCDCGRLTIYKARDGSLGTGQRRPVILFGCRPGGNRCRGRRHGQCSLFRTDIGERTGHILPVCVQDLVGGNGALAVSCIRLAAGG